MTFFLALGFGWVVWLLLQWSVFNAVFTANLPACQALNNTSACWGVVAEKWRGIVFGRYPLHEQWRAGIVMCVWTALLWATACPAMRKYIPVRVLCGVWAVFMPVAFVLMAGSTGLHLPPIPTALWGGLPLTLILSTLGFALAFPLGLLLALGRRSSNKTIAWACTAYIELLRALPLVTVLFLAAYVLPLVLPAFGLLGGGDLLPRVLVTLAFFVAAYLAEVLRGGFQNVSKGQGQAAKALGLRPSQVQLYVLVPQAVQACLPSLVNSFVTLFKECSLVAIVSLFELTGALGLALAGDVQWRSYYLEGYLFIAMLYWIYCYGLSRACTAGATVGRV